MNWKWELKDIRQDKPVKVFSIFSCGGGSSMGYKRAGFEVVGNVEIDEKINRMYVKNNHPKYNYNMDLRKFNELEDIPEELYHLDILDGSPPCTTFSTAGLRERTWGKEKKFKEGQAMQTLDDLFFVFLDTVEKLRPKVVVAENVTGIIKGNAKGYMNLIVKRFQELGYDVQVFCLNAAQMDVPQKRERVFIIGNNQVYGKLRLRFAQKPIRYGEVKEGVGKPAGGEVISSLLKHAKKNDMKVGSVYKRLNPGKKEKYYGAQIVHDEKVVQTITSGGTYYRYDDKTQLTDEDFRNIQTFPKDYDFCGNNVQYVCGMSVPPNMMAHIAMEIWKQWLKQ